MAQVNRLRPSANEDGVNDSLMLSLYIGPAVLIVLMIAQYIALRIRDTRASPADPHLGRKSGCYFFLNLALTMAAIGLTWSAATCSPTQSSRRLPNRRPVKLANLRRPSIR